MSMRFAQGFARSAPLRACAPAACLFLAGTCLSLPAAAQPNPFEDYEQSVAPSPSAAAAAPSPPPALGPVLETAPMTWSVGLRSQLGFSRVGYQRAGAQDGSATTFLLRLSPALQVFIVDRIQIGLSPGLLVRSGGNSPGDDGTDANMLIEATAHYFAKLSPRFALVPGVGLGGSFGNGTRTLDMQTSAGVTRRQLATQTSGLSLALYVGLAFQITTHMELRSGLAATALFGWDALEGQSSRLSTTSAHIGIPIDIFYTF